MEIRQQSIYEKLIATNCLRHFGRHRNCFDCMIYVPSAEAHLVHPHVRVRIGELKPDLNSDTCILSDDAKLSHFWGENSMSGSLNDQDMISLTGVEIKIFEFWSNTHHLTFLN